ncbi:hypothetical protein AB0L40_20285 [Patulibacter sp. NPDC049589]|uniref:hypothetical protein n=1 Tax=Patulibacter sp. NPDC049589 TaxID=3154731 RepID=UPI00343C5A70
MTDPELRQIDRRIADTLEELRILRVEGNEHWARSDARWAEARSRDEELFTELRAVRETSDVQTAELRALGETSDLQTAELRRVSETNQIQTDALRALLERD